MDGTASFPLECDHPTFYFFLCAICYAWGVGDVSDTATPFSGTYAAVLLFTSKVTKFRSASRQDPYSCFRFLDLE
jgi:hypothetical protein